jgi:hypothetical protein
MQAKGEGLIFSDPYQDCIDIKTLGVAADN